MASEISKLMEILILRRIRKQRKRKFYIRKIFRNRIHQGEIYFVNELSTDSLYHYKYFRMAKDSFNYLLDRIGPKIAHPKTHAYPISERLRLAVTLRYLASGSSQFSIACSYRISPSSVSKILRETLAAIWDEFVEKKAEEYYDIWNFPNCCGALDGKHIRIKNLANFGSEFYNYKRYFSIILLISADAKYQITYCDIGASGSSSDISALEYSEFGNRLFRNELPLPQAVQLPNSDKINPYIFLGDGGFPLKKNLMRPYPMDGNLNKERKVFNYRLSRARRVSENTFGILAARFRIFRTEIEASYELAVSIIKASVVLHNFLMKKSDLFELTTDMENVGELTLGNWREITTNDSGYIQARRLGTNNFSKRAEEIRQTFAQYFSNENILNWQNTYVERGS